jgi:TubC N-terminal docking domain
MNAEAFLNELSQLGVHIEPLPNGNLYAAPTDRLTAELIDRIRQYKPDLLEHFRAKKVFALADEALTVLRRLKCYTLPSGRMAAAQEIADRCAFELLLWDNGEPLGEADDPASVLNVLRNIERELVAIGGFPDPDVAQTIEMVERTFPGARLIDIRRKLN